MLQISPSMRIFVCNQFVDFRKGIDGLAAICRNMLNQDPFQGALFIFRNRTRSTIRCLVYDGQGFWLCTKRLSKGKFKWWPDDQKTVDARQIQTLLWNGNPELAKFSDDWRKFDMK
jgi:transposase